MKISKLKIWKTSLLEKLIVIKLLEQWHVLPNCLQINSRLSLLVWDPLKLQAPKVVLFVFVGLDAKRKLSFLYG